MAGRIETGVAVVAVLAALAAAVAAVVRLRARRGIATAMQRATYDVLHTAALAAGALSPFGEDHSFPMPVDLIRYAHPTDKPNRAGVQVVEGR